MAKRISPTDVLMLLLALVSVALLAFDVWGTPTPTQHQQIVLIDTTIVAIFVIEYAIRFAKAEQRPTFVLRTWYELIGMVPIMHPAFRAFRLLRVVRIAVVLARVGRATDRAFGEAFTYQLVKRFKNIIVEIIGDAVTVRVMDMTLDVLEKGDYANNMANHLEARGDDMMDIIIDKVVDDPQLGRIRHVPFFEDVVATSSRVTQRVLIDLLRDPRMDAMIKDMIRANVRQMRQAVWEKESLKAA